MSTLQRLLASMPPAFRTSTSRRCPFLAVFLACGLAAVFIPGCAAGEAETPPAQSATSDATRNGMVVSAHPLASEVGLKILQDGGNAFDAAVAVAAVLPLLQPGASALSGAGAALFYQGETSEIEALSWFTRSPVSPDFAKRREELLDPLSMVRARPPGSLAGLAALLEKHGTMSLAQVLHPAIQHAEKGVTVTEVMHRSLRGAVERLRRYPNAAETYLVDGEPPPVGSVLKYPHLARTMRLIAEKGPDVLYKGEIGKELVEFIGANGGLIGWKDLELASQPTWHAQPLSTTYRGYTIYGVPPVASGIELLEMMNVLEQFDLRGLPAPQRAHAMAEAFKLAMIDRQTYLGDPAFVDIPVEKLLSKPYAVERAATVKQTGVLPWALPYPGGDVTDSTTHFVVADKARNLVSVTNSVGGLSANWHIGQTGLILSAGVSGMSQHPKHPNYAEPGKYQQMTMGPVLVKDPDGKLVLALGAAGGNRITQAIAQVIVNVIDRGMSVQEATSAPRLSYGRPEADLTVSADFDPEAVEALKRLGHKTSVGRSAAIHAVAIDPATGALRGGADPGGEGKPAGY